MELMVATLHHDALSMRGNHALDGVERSAFAGDRNLDAVVERALRAR
jgi:hypothetical protein